MYEFRVKEIRIHVRVSCVELRVRPARHLIVEALERKRLERFRVASGLDAKFMKGITDKASRTLSLNMFSLFI